MVAMRQNAEGYLWVAVVEHEVDLQRNAAAVLWTIVGFIIPGGMVYTMRLV